MSILKKRTSGEHDRTLRRRAKGPSRSYHLVHVTSVGSTREIIRAGQIETRSCRVFDRDLVYFFALRPAYKLKGSDEKRSIIDFFPSVFLVSTEHISVPFHVYPFDTGGAFDGAFDLGASENVHLEDYELDNTLQAVNDHILWEFGTREDYFDGKLKDDFEEKLSKWDVGPVTFSRIAGLASVRSNRPDLRASAVEMAFDVHVRLDSVRMIILPKQFMEDPNGNNTKMMTNLETAGVEWATYEWQPNRTPGDFHSEINQMVRNYLESWNDL